MQDQVFWMSEMRRKICLWFGASMRYYEVICNLLDRSTKNVFVCDHDESYHLYVGVESSHMDVVRKILKRCQF
ncbi:unnamed protein product, partial [Brassica napus]